MTTITQIFAREVLDSRGRPTVEVDVWLGEKIRGRAIVPSGASTGRAEAQELRDGDPRRYGGRGVRKAVENVNQQIAPELIGIDAADQEGLDQRLIDLDGTEQKTNLGANATLGVSLAAARAAAQVLKVPLFGYIGRLSQLLPATGDSTTTPPVRSGIPRPMVNMISGGLHAGTNLDFQDFLAIPVGASDYATGLEWMVRLHWKLGELLIESGHEGRLLADEGGYGPRLGSHREAAEFCVRAIEAIGLRPGADIALALDVAASHFYDGPYYMLSAGGEAKLGSMEMIDVLESLASEFPIVSIEDGLAEDDWPGWVELTRRLGENTLIVGDDLLATNRKRLSRAVEENAANAILIKPNQIGTLTETLQTIQVARVARFDCICSARSGETEDTFIADLAVGTGSKYIKIGSVTHGERIAKYNRLLRIAEELAS